MILATAGNSDPRKTALVRALTVVMPTGCRRKSGAG